MHKHNAKAKAVPSGASTVTESKLELGTSYRNIPFVKACYAVRVASHAASMSARRARARRIYGRIFRI